MKHKNSWKLSLAFAGLALLTPVLAPAQTPSGQGVALARAERKHVDKYPTVEMRKGKLGEDKAQRVIYLDPNQREDRRLFIENGLVYDHAGRLHADTKSKHGDMNNYVMDAAGNFYLFDEFTTHTIRHSSIFAGGPVAGAGNIQIKGGRIVYIDADSGHYSSKKLFENVLTELSARGVNIDAFGKHRM